MTTPDPQSVLVALDVSPDAPVVEPDGDRWLQMLDVAVDPATDPADPAIVPTMDDDRSYPDEDATPVEYAHDGPHDGDGHHGEVVDHDPAIHDDGHDPVSEGHPGAEHHTDHPDDPHHHDAGQWHA
jgi:hypothetical protein